MNRFTGRIPINESKDVEDQLQVIFDSYSHENDGFLNRYELEEFMLAIEVSSKNDPHLNNKLILALTRSVGKSRDNRISYEEFKRYNTKIENKELEHILSTSTLTTSNRLVTQSDL